jgi:hypothetical protein
MSHQLPVQQQSGLLSRDAIQAIQEPLLVLAEAVHQIVVQPLSVAEDEEDLLEPPQLILRHNFSLDFVDL